jgi:hypothetical protein
VALGTEIRLHTALCVQGLLPEHLLAAGYQGVPEEAQQQQPEEPQGAAQ